jgi:hypothetical protein
MRLALVLSMTAMLSACGGSTAATLGSSQAPPGPTHGEVVSACLDAETDMHGTDQYVGMMEVDALNLAAQRQGGRVVGRDGDCLGRSRDLREGRVNFIISNGHVVWVGVERLPDTGSASAPVPDGACGASGPGWPAGSDVADYQAYEGLTMAQAEKLAERNGDDLRVLGQDGGCVELTTADLRGKRVNLYLDSGVVVSAYAG